MDQTIDHDDARTQTIEKFNGIKKREDVRRDSEVVKIYRSRELQLTQKIKLSDVIAYQNAKSKAMQNDDQNGKQSPDGEDPQSSTPQDNEKKMPKMADNFNAHHINIGSWTWTSLRQGDFMAKLYYQKSRLIWEFLKDALKFKMQIEWSHITAIRATIGDPNQQSSLEIELNKQPVFFRESTPQPRKHTIWEICGDFTIDQAASIFRRQHVIFPPGVFNKPFQKLMECNKRLYNMIQKPFPSYAESSPYFEEIESASNSGNLTDHHYLTTAKGSPNLFALTNFSEPVTAASFMRNEEIQNLQTETLDQFCVNQSNFNIQCPSYNNSIQRYNITGDNIYYNLSVDSQSGKISQDMISRDNQSNGGLSKSFDYHLMPNVNNYSINNAVMNYGYKDANLAMVQNVGNNTVHVNSVLPLNGPEVNESSNVDSVPPLNGPEVNESSNVNMMMDQVIRMMDQDDVVILFK